MNLLSLLRAIKTTEDLTLVEENLAPDEKLSELQAVDACSEVILENPIYSVELTCG